MSALAVTRVGYDPLRDKSYQHTRLGGSVVDFLAWKEMGGAAERTLDQYERDLARGCLMFPNHGLSLSDGEPVFGDSEMLHVARAFKPKERRYRCAAWRSFYKWALKTRRVTVNPTDVLPDMPQAGKKVYDLFTSAEIGSLCSLPIRDGALLEIMFGAGPRKGDCRNLRLRDWRPDAAPEHPYGLIVFREGKGGKDRQVPATEVIARKLSELAILDGLSPNEYLWYTRPGGGSVVARGKPVNDASFAFWWRRCIAEAGVRYRNPHITRHTFATRYLRGRGRLETLQRILGHSSSDTTSDLYVHLDMRDIAFDMGLLSEINQD